ncbi:MAG: YncE family protein, partial [Candidatus Berkiella sp.]
MRYISIANIVKLGLFTVLVCTNFELWAQAQQHSQHKLEDQKAPVCESLKTQAKSKKAYEQCNKYCEDLKCTDPSRKDKLDCLSALAKFQALGLGNPPCIGPKRAYISNYNANTVSTCNVKEDGVFEKCIDSGVGAIFDSPVGIAINSIQNTAYITNYGNNKANYSVSKCAINGAGLFSACVDSGVGVAFTKPFDIALTQDENSAFVTNNEEAIRVSKCDIEKGDFTGCVDTSASMSGRPVGLAFNHANNIVYVANDSGHGVYKCALKDTRFSDCTSTGSGFTNTIGVA